MKQDLLISLRAEVEAQVREKTPTDVKEILVRQKSRWLEAGEKIDAEGSVVRDLKGAVIAHPAMKIEIDAGKIIAELLAKYRK